MEQVLWSRSQCARDGVKPEGAGALISTSSHPNVVAIPIPEHNHNLRKQMLSTMFPGALPIGVRGHTCKR